MLALAFLPAVHVDQPRHEGGAHKIEYRHPHDIFVSLVHIDQDLRIASSGSHETLIQVPDYGGVEHAQLILQVPGVGEGRLTRRGWLTLQLSIETVDGFFLQSGNMENETGTSAEPDQFSCFKDSCSLTALVGIAICTDAWIST